MIYAGEDIKFIARRIMICAAEDVGMADPNALNVATSAALAVERIGLPEARIILSEAVVYVATAPKSDTAYGAVDKALDYVEHHQTERVPVHLMDAHYKASAKLGHGVGYQYAHAFPHHYVTQQYLPDGMENVHFYEPTENGYEETVKEYLRMLEEIDRKSQEEPQ